MTKKRKIILASIGALLVLTIGYRNYRANNQPKKYETATATKGSLIQTVDATGKITSENGVSLRFEVSGALSAVNVREGQPVKKGAVLANLRLAELNAAVAQAQANLNLKLAPSTDQDIAYYKAAVDSAKAALEQVESGSSLLVSQAYDSLSASLSATAPKLDDALTQADNIIAYDNSFANESFRSALSILDPNQLGMASAQYPVAKNAIKAFKDKVITLTPGASEVAVDEVTALAFNAIQQTSLLLNKVSDVLRASSPQGSLTQTSLDTKKTTIETTRITVNTQYTTLLTNKQAVATAKNTLVTKKAAYDQALANYQSKVTPPREVDVAYYRAALSQAVASRSKAIIIAPFDGVITKINKKAGETVSSADPIIELLSPHYEIEVDIPETDVSKVKVGDMAEITLDAFGDDVPFAGKVVEIEPGSTEIQDVVYYKITVSLDDTTKPIKPGMTANVAIETAKKDNILSVPLRTVRTRDDGSKYIRLLVNGEERETTVTLGIRGNEGKVEITSGIAEGDLAIISVQ